MIQVTALTTEYLTHGNELEEVAFVPVSEALRQLLLTFISILCGEFRRHLLVPSLWIDLVSSPIICFFLQLIKCLGIIKLMIKTTSDSISPSLRNLLFLNLFGLFINNFLFIFIQCLSNTLRSL